MRTKKMRGYWVVTNRNRTVEVFHTFDWLFRPNGYERLTGWFAKKPAWTRRMRGPFKTRDEALIAAHRMIREADQKTARLAAYREARRQRIARSLRVGM